MARLSGIPDRPFAKWIALLAGVIPIGFALLSSDARRGAVFMYEATWPLLALFAAALVAMFFAWRARPRTGIRVIREHDELADELRLTVGTANERLLCVGSRGRDSEYLRAIEDRLRAKPSLEHVRILCGPPRHAVLKTHLVRLARELAMPPGRLRVGVLTDNCDEPEQSLCANERRAVIVIPPLGRFGRYDSAVVLTDADDVRRILGYGEGLWRDASPLPDVAAIDALETTVTQRVADDSSGA